MKNRFLFRLSLIDLILSRFDDLVDDLVVVVAVVESSSSSMMTLDHS